MQNAQKLDVQPSALMTAETPVYSRYPSEQMPLPAGSVCTTTYRVVLASPFPNQFQDLMGELSSSCFDLFVLHRLEPGLLRESGADLLIVDLTHQVDEDLLNLECLAALERQAFHTVYLTRHGQQLEPHSLPVRGKVFIWPLEAGVMVPKLQEMIMKQPQQEASDDQRRFGMYCFKDLCIDVKRMIVMKQQERIELTKTEFELLHLLLSADGSVYSREELMGKVWGSSFLGSSNTVDVHIKTIRKKLGDSATAPKYIATVRGVGYRLAI